MTTKKLFIVAAGLLLLLVGGVLYATRPTTSEDIVAQVAEQDNTAPVEAQIDTPEDVSAQPAMEIVSIQNPFDATNVPIATFQKVNNTQNGTIVGITHNRVEDGVLELPAPANFSNVGLRYGAITSGEEMLVVVKYTFTVPGTVTWEYGENTATESWEDHPQKIDMDVGENITVAYVSKDGGQTWVGSVTK